MACPDFSITQLHAIAQIVKRDPLAIHAPGDNPYDLDQIGEHGVEVWMDDCTDAEAIRIEGELKQHGFYPCAVKW